MYCSNLTLLAFVSCFSTGASSFVFIQFSKNDLSAASHLSTPSRHTSYIFTGFNPKRSLSTHRLTGKQFFSRLIFQNPLRRKHTSQIPFPPLTLFLIFFLFSQRVKTFVFCRTSHLSIFLKAFEAVDLFKKQSALQLLRGVHQLFPQCLDNLLAPYLSVKHFPV